MRFRVARAFLGTSLLFLTAAIAGAADGRRVVSHDGTWQIAEGAMDAVPAAFDHKVPVPGLADMAEPPFAAVGEKPVGGASLPRGHSGTAARSPWTARCPPSPS